MKNLSEFFDNQLISMETVGNRPTSQRVSWKGLLAAGLLASVSVSASAHDTSPSFPSGPAYETFQPHAPDAHWIEMPSSPFLEVGRKNDGSIDIYLLLSKWQQAGLTPEEASLAIEHLNLMTPVLMGVQDQDLEKQLLDEAKMASEGLKSKFPQAFNNCERLLQQQPSKNNISWNTDQIKSLKEQWNMTRVEAPSASFVPKVSFDQSKQLLEGMVAETGLHALRIPLSNWTSPMYVARLSEGLKKANEELQMVTGLQGPVLGLGGRLELSLGKPTLKRLMGAEGQAIASRFGRLQLATGWNTFLHEWFHVVDYTASRVVLQNPDNQTLSDHAKHEALSHSKGVYHAWSQSIQDLESLTPRWQAARQKAYQESQQEDWIDPAEGMAYAFSAYANYNYNLTVLKDQKINEYAQNEPFRSPNQEESIRVKPLFEKLFAQIQILNLTQALEASSDKNLKAILSQSASSPKPTTMTLR